MGFWNTFKHTWQVRTAVRIQQGIESYFENQKLEFERLNKQAELKANIPTILNELEKKNHNWEEQINKIKTIKDEKINI